jgi:excisionase family DNA binding protein
MKEIITLKELSNNLHISISEIRKLVRERRIPHFRIGNKIYFSVESINNWLTKIEEKENKRTLFC